MASALQVTLHHDSYFTWGTSSINADWCNLFEVLLVANSLTALACDDYLTQLFFLRLDIENTPHTSPRLTRPELPLAPDQNLRECAVRPATPNTPSC
jgi:hypothetical protein